MWTVSSCTVNYNVKYLRRSTLIYKNTIVLGHDMKYGTEILWTYQVFVIYKIVQYESCQDPIEKKSVIKLSSWNWTSKTTDFVSEGLY